MFTYTHKKAYRSEVYTLSPSVIGLNDSGWTVEGEIHEDYFKWVNRFKATHPTYGVIEGDFNETVTAESEEAFNDFMKNHTPESWDFDNI